MLEDILETALLPDQLPICHEFLSALGQNLVLDKDVRRRCLWRLLFGANEIVAQLTQEAGGGYIVQVADAVAEDDAVVLRCGAEVFHGGLDYRTDLFALLSELLCMHYSVITAVHEVDLGEIFDQNTTSDKTLSAGDFESMVSAHRVKRQHH